MKLRSTADFSLKILLPVFGHESQMLQSESDLSYHTPVLVEEVISLLAPRSGGVYLDGTVGGGGHARAILEASAPEGRLFALDQDDEALEAAKGRLAPYRNRVTFRHGNFLEAREVFPGLRFDGILLDLGVSSHQLDTPDRGFSCDREGPLDMRMDLSLPENAAGLLARLDETALARIFRGYGESKFSRRIAREIVRQRAESPLLTTTALARIVRGAVPQLLERKNLVQVFQALRIAVNNELGALQAALGQLFELLLPAGRLAVIAYHSLEDRIVKVFFAGLATGCICPRDFPVCRCGKTPEAKILTRKPVRPAGAELGANPRSRSALLRAAEKLNPAEA